MATADAVCGGAMEETTTTESRAVNSSQRVGFGTNPVSHGRNQSTQSRLGQLSSVWSTRILGWFNSVKPSQTRLTTVNSKIRNALVAR
uniref:Uncharacterized protein n=1 Tax=Helianthus annuus TaxID=4232 RepID=A0A251TD49_HELAN